MLGENSEIEGDVKAEDVLICGRLIVGQQILPHHGWGLSAAPQGNSNAVKHGGFTKELLERRAMLREQIRQAQKLLKDLGG